MGVIQIRDDSLESGAAARGGIFREAARGAAAAAPIVMGYVPIGFAFGVLASTAGLSVGAAAAMSVFVYAGSAQLISVGLLEGGAGILSLTMTVFLVNLRHLLMSAYLSPYLGRFSRLQQALFAFELTDESFAVHSTRFQKMGPHSSLQPIALNMTAHLSWVASTLVGAWTGTRLLLDSRVFGLDYALPAMFIALLVMQLENMRTVCIALLAAGLSVTLCLAGLGHWHIILATLVAATAGTVTERNRQGLNEGVEPEQ